MQKVETVIVNEIIDEITASAEQFYSAKTIIKATEALLEHPAHEYLVEGVFTMSFDCPFKAIIGYFTCMDSEGDMDETAQRVHLGQVYGVLCGFASVSDAINGTEYSAVMDKLGADRFIELTMPKGLETIPF